MEEKKMRIVEACKQSFSLFGYKGTTVEQIAKIAGVGKGTVYLYFETKEDILHEIVKQVVSEMLSLAEESLKSGTTITEKLHNAIFSCLLYRKEHEMLMKLAQEVAQFGTEPAKNALAQVEEGLIGFITSIMEKGIQAGTVKASHPEVTAFVLFKMYVALVLDWENKHHKLTNDEISELLKQYILHGLVPTIND